MLNRKEVISVLEYLIEEDCTDTQHDYVNEIKEAIALLKAREPTTYAYDEYKTPTCQNCSFSPLIMYRPTLERMKQMGYSYCPRCGRRINWEVSGNAAN